MKYVQRGLLMMLIVALVMPAPMALAETESEENNIETTDVSNIVENTADIEVLPAEEKLSMEIVDSNEDSKPTSTDELASSNPAVNVSSEQADIVKDEVATQSAPTPTKLLITKIRTDGGGDKEFVEIYNPSEKDVNLAGWQLQFVDSSGKSKPLNTFTNNNIIASKSFLVVAHDSYFNEIAADIRFDIRNKSGEYNKTQALLVDGTVELIDSTGKFSDRAGWYKEKKNSAKGFEANPVRSENGFTLQRCVLSNAEVRDTDDNASDFSVYLRDDDSELIGLREFIGCPVADSPVDDPVNDIGPDTPQTPANKCEGLRLSEIAANVDDQFVEVINGSDKVLDISGCKLTTKHKDKVKVHIFENLELRADELLAVKIGETDLTLTKTSKGTVSLLDSSDSEIDVYSYPAMKSSTSMIFLDSEWVQTYALTPDEKNIWQEFAACEAGYVRNPTTGRCNKIAVATELEPCGPGQFRNPETGRCKKIEVAKTPVPCKEGYYRSEETGRCRSIAATAAKTLKPCADDEFRNPLTNRCKKIAADSDVLKECPEGYERNPVTNRCRKVKSTSMPLAAFAPMQVQQIAVATWGWWVFGGVSLLALSVAGWQWRWEITRIWRKIISAVGKR